MKCKLFSVKYNIKLLQDSISQTERDRKWTVELNSDDVRLINGSNSK